MSTNNPYDVKPGQVWQDCDPRGPRREVRVVKVGETHATVASSNGLGRQTRIRLDRFKPTATGYRLVSDSTGARS